MGIIFSGGQIKNHTYWLFIKSLSMRWRCGLNNLLWFVLSSNRFDIVINGNVVRLFFWGELYLLYWLMIIKLLLSCKTDESLWSTNAKLGFFSHEPITACDTWQTRVLSKIFPPLELTNGMPDYFPISDQQPRWRWWRRRLSQQASIPRLRQRAPIPHSCLTVVNFCIKLNIMNSKKLTFEYLRVCCYWYL